MRLVSVFIPMKKMFYWFVLLDFFLMRYLAERGLV